MTQSHPETDPQLERLLEAHVRHELAALKGDRLAKFLSAETGRLFALTDSVTLDRVASPGQVMGLIRRVVMNMELGGALPGLAGAMASQVLNAGVQSTTRVRDILPREQASAFLQEALALRQHRERMISEIMAHPVYQDLVANLAYQALVNYLYEDNLVTRNVPGMGSMMKFGKRMANRAVPGLDENLEKRLRGWLAESLPGLIARSEEFLQSALDDEELHDSVMAAWDAVEDKTLADLQSGLGDVQLHEFVVLGYDFWRNFRQTAYFEACCQAVVEHLFERYGEQPLSSLLADLGVDRDLVSAEVANWGLPLMQVLREEGYLEALVRRRLEPFYRSAAARKALARPGD